MPGTDSLAQLRYAVTGCRACPRLVAYRERVAHERKRAFAAEEYWGRPVMGFGDPNARLALVGLAPSAHGANRTGRPFTGDRSGDFLARALFAAGFANRPASARRGDGLRYTGLYLTAAVRCVPPDNRPRPEERARCAPYLVRELSLLPELQAILALGGFAWDAVLSVVPELYEAPAPREKFAHGAFVALGPGRPHLYGAYHPSPQNTQTGKLTEAMFVDLLRRISGGLRGPGDRPGQR